MQMKNNIDFIPLSFKINFTTVTIIIYCYKLILFIVFTHKKKKNRNKKIVLYLLFYHGVGKYHRTFKLYLLCSSEINKIRRYFFINKFVGFILII